MGSSETAECFSVAQKVHFPSRSATTATTTMISQRSYKKLVSMLVGDEPEVEPPKKKGFLRCCGDGVPFKNFVNGKVLLLTLTIWTAALFVVMFFALMNGPMDPYGELSVLKKTTRADEAFLKQVNELLLEWAENRYDYGNQLFGKDMKKIVERGGQMTEERVKLAYKYVHEMVENNRTDRAIMDTVELYVRLLGHQRSVETARFLSTYIGSGGSLGMGLLTKIQTLYDAEMLALIKETLPERLRDKSEHIWVEYTLYHTPGLKYECLDVNSTVHAMLLYYQENYINKCPTCVPRTPWYQNDALNGVILLVGIITSFIAMYLAVGLIMKKCVVQQKH
ncbi:hypothetical protein QR680_003622 [Steinernema hermaphroditum]|uniref:Uncharacterized protein n=1 Tax=Steinernema hermaphroditum TaxID=289476 RepID=A0AA39HKZ5_9BILA|nr:hypothetical protein QR680_003622 [Steinernema hermaphroditum]